MKLQDIRKATRLLDQRERYEVLRSQSSSNTVFTLVFNGTPLPVSRRDIGNQIDMIIARVLRETDAALKELGVEIPGEKD